MAAKAGNTTARRQITPVVMQPCMGACPSAYKRITTVSARELREIRLKSSRDKRRTDRGQRRTREPAAYNCNSYSERKTRFNSATPLCGIRNPNERNTGYPVIFVAMAATLRDVFKVGFSLASDGILFMSM